MSYINALKNVLADSYALALKTQNYHWNVEGQNFYSLHKLFEEQYNEISSSIDEIAELIRTLGEKAPASFTAYIAMSKIKEGKVEFSAEEMIQDLLQSQDVICETLNICLAMAQEAGDEVTADIMIGRLTAHRKHKWFLKSSL